MKSLQNTIVVVIVAFITTQLPSFRRMLNSYGANKRDKLFLSFFFGTFSALGIWVGFPLLGSLVSCKIVGVVAGGLLGGPLVGLGAAIIGAVPRYFLGGFTTAASIAANLAIGCFAGLVNSHYGLKRIDLKIALATALGSELILKTLILTMSKPFEAAWELEKKIALPTTVANCFGLVLFIYIVREVFTQQGKIQAESAQSAMLVIKDTAGLLRHGLTEESALRVARTIYSHTAVAAVAITDTVNILAFVGKGDDHHRAGFPHRLASTRLVLDQRMPMVSNDKNAIGCSHASCPLTAVVDAPLIVERELLGSIKIFKSGKDIVTPYESELIQGIAEFLSLQLLQLKLDKLEVLRSQAEFQALRAQINPHFLYNTLGTIRALVRKDPEIARLLIKDLADFMRKTLHGTKEIGTFADELEIVRRYIRIEKARFGDRVLLVEQIPEEMLSGLLPVFSLQPLVENAVKHGISPKNGGGTVRISAWSSVDTRYIEVEDDGTGIPEAKLSHLLRGESPYAPESGTGIGLNNVNQRLQRMFGERFGLKIQSKEGTGTKITVSLPLLVEGG
jgi:LytS/YehU family sensor histidine kinase